MRSSKTPLNQKNRGQVLPHPYHRLPNLTSEPRSMGVFGHFRNLPRYVAHFSYVVKLH